MKPSDSATCPWRDLAFNRVPVGLLVADEAGRILDVNERLLAWCGWTWDDLDGRTWHEHLLTAAGQVLVRTHLLPLLQARGRAHDIALDLRTAAGGRMHVNVDLDAMPVRSGTPDGQLVAFTKAVDHEAWELDLLEAKRRAEDSAQQLRELNLDLERRVEARTRDLARANQDLAAYARTVAHDLRTPLQAVLALTAALDLTAGPGLSPEQRRLLDRITQAGTAMGSLVEAMLQTALAADKPIRLARVDLSAIATRLASELQAAAPGRTVAWELAPGLEAQGDADLLEVVLRNLLGNAWKYTARSPGARIAFRAEPADGQPVFCVRDNGPGFDAARAADLFQPFQRYHGADEAPGLGIGLATVKRIIDRHGGTLWAESAVGQGAAFRFTLPGTS